MKSNIAFSRLLIVGVAIATCFALLSQGITREVPFGGVTGTVRMKENGRLLPDARVILRPDIDWSTYDESKVKPEDRPRTYATDTDDDGFFRLSSVRAGKYLLEVYGDVHRVDDIPVEVVEGKPASRDVELEPSDPYLDILASQHVFTPGQKIEFGLHGFTKKDDTHIRTYSLPFAKVLASNGLETLLRSFRNRWNDRGIEPAKVGKLVSDTVSPNTGRDIEGVFRASVKLGSLDEGLYWVECYAEGMRLGTWFVVSKIGLVTKIAENKAECFVTDLMTGKAVPGATISTGQGETAVAKGKTGPDGTLSYQFAPKENHRQVTMAQYGNSWAVADSYVSGESTDGQINTFLYSDRPVYRPGDTVEFKGISRILKGKNYEVLASKPVTVVVRDLDDNILKRFDAKTNDMGSFSGQFETNKEMSPGDYFVEVELDGHKDQMSVTLAAYRKPTYQIKVTPEKKMYAWGDHVKVYVDVEYYFGGPVVGAEVEANVDRQSLWSYDSGDEDSGDDYSYEYSYGGEYIDNFSAVTDDNGRAVIEFDTKRDEDKERPPAETDFLYNINASVSDAGGKYFEGSGSVKVTRGQFDLRIESNSYVVDSGQPVSYQIKAVDNLTGKPAAGVSVTTKFGYSFWSAGKSEFHQQDFKTVVTDASGMATVEYVPKRAGDYEVEAHATDQKGNDILATSYVWVTPHGESFGWDGVRQDEELLLKLDKKDYKPGDTAKAVIRTSKLGVSGWLTIEGDELYESRVIQLDQPVVTVDIPVRQQHSPDVYVSICFIKNKKFYSRTRRLAVDLGVKKLDVAVTSDKADYQPGDTVHYTVQTKTSDGKPTPADVSLGVVDESIYAIASDNTDIASNFYPMRYNEVETSYSFPEVYLDGGDKAPSSIQIRRKFRDTAFWAPSVRTGVNGLANVAVKLPDNLTSWRATAVGITADTAVGQTTQNVRARKPLMVRLEAPSFWVQSDQQRLVAAVTNDSGKDADVNLDIQVEGAKVNGDMKQKQFIRAGETKAFEWDVDVPNSGEAKFTARTWIDSTINDGVELKVPILPHAREFVDYKAGFVSSDSKMDFVLQQGFDPNMGGLTVTLTPSLGSTIYQSLDYLADFPYGCVEQTLSRFVPSLVASKITDGKGQARPERFKKVDQWVAEGLSRLRMFQHNDGGWGWWEYDDSDSFMTAMVLEALYKAKSAGYDVNSYSVKRGLEWAAKILKSPMPYLEKDRYGHIMNQWTYDDELHGRMYLCYALALHGSSAAAAEFMKQFPIKKLNAVDVANAALAYNAMGPNYGSQRDNALSHMISLGSETPSIMTWEEVFWGRETTAKALYALTEIRPDDPRINKILVGLMMARRSDHWYSTRDTNYVLMGMMNVWKRQQEVTPDLTVTVRVNGKDFGSLHIDQNFIQTPIQTVKIPPSAMRQGQNTVQLVPSGSGQCYYSASLQQFAYQKQIGQMSTDKGFTVTRNYYRIVPQKMEDGSHQLVPDKNPVESLNRGDLVFCVVNVHTDSYREYVIVEDPLPSNCIVMDREVAEDREDWYSYAWYDKMEIKDDRIAFFDRYLSAGDHKYSYTLKAENPGKAHVLPTNVYNMYDTDKRASSAENSLEVRR